MQYRRLCKICSEIQPNEDEVREVHIPKDHDQQNSKRGSGEHGVSYSDEKNHTALIEFIAPPLSSPKMFSQVQHGGKTQCPET